MLPRLALLVVASTPAFSKHYAHCNHNELGDDDSIDPDWTSIPNELWSFEADCANAHEKNPNFCQHGSQMYVGSSILNPRRRRRRRLSSRSPNRRRFRYHAVGYTNWSYPPCSTK